MKAYCVYHMADNDGICSAAVVRRLMPAEVTLIKYNYGDIPENINELQSGDYLFIVDCTLTNDDGSPAFKLMHDMRDKGVNVVWVDHHCPMLEQYDAWLADEDNPHKGAKPISGFRNCELAACELTWIFMNNWLTKGYDGKSMPAVVELIGKYDSWRHNMDDTVLDFYYGLEQYLFWPDDPMWDKFLGEPWPEEAEKIFLQGGIIRKFQMNKAYRVLASSGSVVKWHGYNFIAVNSQIYSSLEFIKYRDQMMNTHGIKIDGTLAYYRTSAGKWKYSIRSFDPDCKVSEIAIKYGGGGHEGAGGWLSDEMLTEVYNEVLETSTRKRN